VPGIFADEHRGPAPIGVESAYLEAAVHESFLVEQAVGREEELSVDVPDDRLAAAPRQRHIERTIIEGVVPDLVEPNAHIERPWCSNSRGVLRVKVPGQRTGGHRNVADSAFHEVSGERGFGEDRDVGTGLERVYLRKNTGEAGEVGGIVALTRLELN